MISDQPDWEGCLGELVRAGSREDAYLKTAQVIVDAIPGGNAPASDASDIVDAILAIPQIRQHAYRSCLLWILVLIARWTGVWQAADESGGGSIAAESLEHERATRTRLTVAAERLRDMVSDPDAEVRSMAYRLQGSAFDEPSVIRWLKDRAESEGDPLAKGCAVEGAYVAMVRAWPEVDPGLVDWLQQCAHTDTTVVRGRIRHVLEGHALPSSRQPAADLLGVPADDLPPEGPFWPVELI